MQKMKMLQNPVNNIGKWFRPAPIVAAEAEVHEQNYRHVFYSSDNDDGDEEEEGNCRDGNTTVSANSGESGLCDKGARLKECHYQPLGVIAEIDGEVFQMSETIAKDKNDDHSEDDSLSDMAQLKAATARLKLKTRRPSYVAWQEHVLEKPRLPRRNRASVDDDFLTEERKSWISNALQWITQELSDMRCQDQHLARQLLSIRQEIHRIKLDTSCEVHQDMLADVQREMEELGELAEICDQLPPDRSVHDNPLRHLGVTRMNISTRRFSTC